jgi:hypothetical protein
MADERLDDSSRQDETAKLELPSLSLRGLRRKRRKPMESTPEPAPQPAPTPEPERAPVSTADETPYVQRAPQEPDRARPRGPRLPTLPGWLAALLSGLVVGVLGALLTYLSSRGCDAVRGTKSCGGGPGLLLLVAILALMVLLGAVLLAALRLPDARATSFLGVGVLTVVVMLTLMDQLFSPWMFLVVPVVGAAAYVLAHGVATAFIEPGPEPGPEHDVR